MDIPGLIGAVTREITSREYEGKPARVLVASRRYETDTDDLWDALTNPERLPRWFLPVSGDLKPGGNYQLEGNASGDILRCEPPQHLSLTWGMHGQISWVNITLSEAEDSTLLTLEHIAHVPDDMWKQFGPGAVGVGWDLALLGLHLHLISDVAVDPAEAAAWPASEEGRLFVAQSSAGWCEASIAAGTDAEEAKAAADNVSGFYTSGGES